MSTERSTEEARQARSRFVRSVVQHSRASTTSSAFVKRPPKRIVQFWDVLDQLPGDVRECIDTWRAIGEQGVERLLFDKHQARDFISHTLGHKYSKAYDKCYHPAMQSDYFRLCYILVEGGCYVDTDDVYDRADVTHLFTDGRLRLQPLCYDMASDSMVPSSLFTTPGADGAGWIFYFNNNPLIAASGHPLIERALIHATHSLECDVTTGLPEIQSTTGPGNLTESIFDAVTENADVVQTVVVLHDWDTIAKTKWDLGYRNDARNWRLGNRQAYHE